MTTAPTNSEELRLTPGALLRADTGAVYELTGECLDGADNGPLVLYRALAPHAQVLACPRALVGPKFSLIPAADPAPLKKFWYAYFGGPDILSLILSKYAEPWRVATTQRYVYRLFEVAQANAMPVDLECGLVLLLQKVVHTPGASRESQAEHSWLVARSLAPLLGAVPIDWERVRVLWDAPAGASVTDLLRSPLAFEPLEFCVNEELLWEEARPLFPGLQGRKGYETQRLKHLLELAARGPAFSKERSQWERSARTNIEGLRQAWQQKYA